MLNKWQLLFIYLVLFLSRRTENHSVLLGTTACSVVRSAVSRALGRGRPPSWRKWTWTLSVDATSLCFLIISFDYMVLPCMLFFYLPARLRSFRKGSEVPLFLFLPTFPFSFFQCLLSTCCVPALNSGPGRSYHS